MSPKTPKNPPKSAPGTTFTSFATYAKAHPEERFWQALRNWSGHDFILAGNMTSSKGGQKVTFDQIPLYLQDTFNNE